MKRFLFLLFVSLPLSLYAGQIGDNFEYSGYLKSEVWIKHNNNSNDLSLSSFKNTFDIAMEYKFSDDWVFFFHPRYFYDFGYSLRDSDSFDRNQAKMGNTQRAEWLRDCYLDYTSDEIDIRVGKQQIVWGQADGIPFLDRVMPFDLSYAFLPDYADIRIPLWMVKLEYSPEVNSTLQFLLIPDFEASRSAPAGAPFAFKAVNDFEMFKNVMNGAGGSVSVDLHRPSNQFSSSRIGLRWRSMLGNLEYTLNWLYGYSTSAFTYTESLVLPGGPPSFVMGAPIGTYKYSRRHKLMHLLGFSFNKAIVDPGFFEGLTIRGEFAYFHDEPTYYGLTHGRRNFTEPSDKYSYVLGFDKNFFTDLLFSFQFGQLITDKKTFQGNQVLNAFTYGLADKVENFFSLKLAKDFLHSRLNPETLILYNDDGDGRITTKLKFEATENLWLTLGYHYFWGDPWTSNGQYRNNDHIFYETKLTF